MFKYLNRKRPLQLILFVGLFSFLLYTVITKDQQLSETGTAFLFQRFVRLFHKSEWMGKGILIACLILQVFFMQFFFKRNEFSPKKTLLPACLYISILLITHSFVVISPFLFTSLFFLIVISIDYSILSVKLKSNVFWVGVLIAVATCFDHSSMLLLILVVVTLNINQYSKLKEIGILFFGFFIMYLYLFSYYFFTNNLNEWIATFQQLNYLAIPDSEFLPSLTRICSIAILSVIYFYFIIRTRIINESKIIKQRNRIFTFNIWSVLLLAGLFLTNSTYPQFLGYIFVPLAIYLAILAQEKNPFYINEIVAIITFVALWL